MASFKKLENGFLDLTMKLMLANRMRIRRKRVKGLTRRCGSAEQHKSATAYFAPYCKINTIFHDFYYDKTGVWDDRFVPDDLWFSRLDGHFNAKRMARVLENKCYYGKMFSGVKQPELFAYRLNGLWFDAAGKLTRQEDVLASAEAEGELIVKIAIASSGGHGVFFVNRDKGDLVSELKRVLGGIREDIIIQRPIRQCQALNRLSASSVNTVRVLSLLSEDGVKIYSAIVRMGINNSRVDNASSGGIMAGVDENGRLRHYAYKKNGERFEAHPTSGTTFDDVVIPGYDKVREAVKKLAVQVPHFRMVSWDIAVDAENEPVLIEANLAGGGVIYQLCNGPLFGDDTGKIFSEVFGRR